LHIFSPISGSLLRFKKMPAPGDTGTLPSIRVITPSGCSWLNRKDSSHENSVRVPVRTGAGQAFSQNLTALGIISGLISPKYNQ
jgi:hypothetical protein